MTRYHIVQPILPRTDPTWQTTATIISRHRTRNAAERKIAQMTRLMRRRPGQQTAWLDWHVVEVNVEHDRMLEYLYGTNRG